MQVISLMLFIYCLALQFDLAKVNTLYVFPFSSHIQVFHPHPSLSSSVSLVTSLRGSAALKNEQDLLPQ